MLAKPISFHIISDKGYFNIACWQRGEEVEIEINYFYQGEVKIRVSFKMTLLIMKRERDWEKGVRQKENQIKIWDYNWDQHRLYNIYVCDYSTFSTVSDTHE